VSKSIRFDIKSVKTFFAEFEKTTTYSNIFRKRAEKVSHSIKEEYRKPITPTAGKNWLVKILRCFKRWRCFATKL